VLQGTWLQAQLTRAVVHTRHSAGAVHMGVPLATACLTRPAGRAALPNSAGKSSFNCWTGACVSVSL